MDITPILTGIPQKTGTTLTISIITFDIETTTGLDTFWQVKTAEGEVIADGNYHFSQSEYDNRDGTNAYIQGIVLTALGLTAL